MKISQSGREESLIVIDEKYGYDLTVKLHEFLKNCSLTLQKLMISQGSEDLKVKSEFH